MERDSRKAYKQGEHATNPHQTIPLSQHQQLFSSCLCTMWLLLILVILVLMLYLLPQIIGVISPIGTTDNTQPVGSMELDHTLSLSK